MKQSIAVLALIGNISAVLLQREPLLANNASELLVHQKPSYSDYPVDYKVPDFGVSHEIAYTQSSIVKAENQLNHKLNADWSKTAAVTATPRGYTVPDFGVDTDILATQSNLAQAETFIGNLIIQGQKEEAAKAKAAAKLAAAKAEAAIKLAAAKQAAQAKLNALKAAKLDEQTESLVIEENVTIIETIDHAGQEFVSAAREEGEAEVQAALGEEKASADVVNQLEEFQKTGESKVVAAKADGAGAAADAAFDAEFKKMRTDGEAKIRAAQLQGKGIVDQKMELMQAKQSAAKEKADKAAVDLTKFAVAGGPIKGMPMFDIPQENDNGSGTGN